MREKDLMKQRTVVTVNTAQEMKIEKTKVKNKKGSLQRIAVD